MMQERLCLAHSLFRSSGRQSSYYSWCAGLARMISHNFHFWRERLIFDNFHLGEFGGIKITAFAQFILVGYGGLERTDV